MAERKSLVEGLKATSAVDPALESQFVFGKKSKSDDSSQPHVASAVPERREGKGRTGNAINRVPLTTRVRSDFAAALKRASLERQLNEVFPNTLQDILEEALQPWLSSNGYLN